jgi:hypothetical protein
MSIFCNFPISCGEEVRFELSKFRGDIFCNTYPGIAEIPMNGSRSRNGARMSFNWKEANFKMLYLMKYTGVHVYFISPRRALLQVNFEVDQDLGAVCTVVVIKQSCKQANHLILTTPRHFFFSTPRHFFSLFFLAILIFFFLDLWLQT